MLTVSLIVAYSIFWQEANQQTLEQQVNSSYGSNPISTTSAWLAENPTNLVGWNPKTQALIHIYYVSMSGK